MGGGGGPVCLAAHTSIFNFYVSNEFALPDLPESKTVLDKKYSYLYCRMYIFPLERYIH